MTGFLPSFLSFFFFLFKPIYFSYIGNFLGTSPVIKRELSFKPGGPFGITILIAGHLNSQSTPAQNPATTFCLPDRTPLIALLTQEKISCALKFVLGALTSFLSPLLRPCCETGQCFPPSSVSQHLLQLSLSSFSRWPCVGSILKASQLNPQNSKSASTGYRHYQLN